MLRRVLSVQRHQTLTSSLVKMLSSTPTPVATSNGVAKVPGTKGKDEKEAFVAFFESTLLPTLKADLTQFRLPQAGRDWIEEMLPYTSVGGKMNRGLTVPSALRSLLSRELTESEMTQALVLGWCVELLQAFFLVADDIMDGSITRRGAPCWYRKQGVGMVAINDSFLLESAIYRLLKQFFKSEVYYGDLLELFHEVTYQTELGQLMDLITAPEGDVDLSRFSIDK